MDYADRIRKKITEVFPHVERLSSTARTADFEVDHDDITFEKLAGLSEWFQTKEINFDKGRYTPGCDSCGHGAEAKVEIRITNIKHS